MKDEIIANFLRRWSTVEITNENAFLFEEHLFGAELLASKEGLHLLEGLSAHSTRKEFAERYRKLLNTISISDA